MRQLLGSRGREAQLGLDSAQRAAAPQTGQVLGGRRSRRYLDALTRLDPGNSEPTDVSAIVEDVLAEFGPGAGLPIGVLARCWLGPPYEVHSLDLAGGIVEHYHAGAHIPDPYSRARSVALHESYIAIEIYPDRLMCLREDGTAVELHS